MLFVKQIKKNRSPNKLLTIMIFERKKKKIKNILHEIKIKLNKKIINYFLLIKILL